jgi:hypothetical protein
MRLAGLPDESGVPIGMAARLGGGVGMRPGCSKVRLFAASSPEIRSPKPEIRRRPELRNPKGRQAAGPFRVSDFGLRASDLGRC